MDMEQNDIWEDNIPDEDEIGACEKCGQITEVFKSEKDGKYYCLNRCSR